MPRLLPFVRVPAIGFSVFALAAVAQGQYQDVSGQAAGGQIYTNNRTQANLSDQGTGYSSSQLSLYGPYYTRLLTNQNNANNANNASRRGLPLAGQGLLSGRPASGLPLSGRQLNGRMFPLRKTYVATPLAALGLTLSETDGKVRVLRVRELSPMARVGLMADDQLVAVNGQSVITQQQVEDALKAGAIGQKIPIDVVRGGKKQTLVWKPEPQDLPTAQSRPAEGPAGQVEPLRFITAALLSRDNSGKTYLGVTLDEKVADQAIVRTVASGSPAQQARLQAGDRIYSISGIWLKSPQDLARIVEPDRPGTSVYLYIGRESGADKAPSDARPAPAAPAAPVQPVPARRAP